MSIRVNIMHTLIAQHRTMGINPQEIHANKPTVDSFAAEAELKPVVPPDKRSPIDRLLNRGEEPAPCLVFDGCKLVVNPRIAGEALLIRPAILMSDPDWLNKIQMHPAARGPQGQQLIMPEGQETPWMERIMPREPAAPAPEGTMEALAQAGGITCTDVIIKAMEGMDKIEHVLVVRYYRNGDVDMSSTLDKLGIQGGLMKALNYVQGRE